MGSDLYIGIDVQNPNGTWSRLFDGPSQALARGIIVDAFDECDARDSSHGYLTPSEMVRMAETDRNCSWRNDEPYWVRQIGGQFFCDIIRERRWRLLQDGDFHDKECSPELRAFAAAVKSLMDDGCAVRIWCWHSQ